MARPKGSKNKQTVPKFEEFKGKFPAAPRIKGVYLTLSKEAIETIRNRASETGLSPQQVLEDLVAAGDYTMRDVYTPLVKFRERIRERREKANVVRNGSIAGEQESDQGISNRRNEEPFLGENGNMGSSRETVETASSRSDDALIRSGHRPEDNPAFADPAGVGDVIETDPYPQEYPSEEPEPIEEEEEIPQE